jgi:hypothetical protein
MLKSIINFIQSIKTGTQLEYYIRSKNPQNHAELERIVRDYYSIRGM